MNASEYNRAYYKRTRESHLATVKARQKLIRDQVHAIKIGQGCSECGYNKCPQALQYHHPNDDKEGEVGRWTARGFKLDRILEEIKKCILPCSVGVEG